MAAGTGFPSSVGCLFWGRTRDASWAAGWAARPGCHVAATARLPSRPLLAKLRACAGPAFGERRAGAGATAPPAGRARALQAQRLLRPPRSPRPGSRGGRTPPPLPATPRGTPSPRRRERAAGASRPRSQRAGPQVPGAPRSPRTAFLFLSFFFSFLLFFLLLVAAQRFLFRVASKAQRGRPVPCISGGGTLVIVPDGVFRGDFSTLGEFLFCMYAS